MVPISPTADRPTNAAALDDATAPPKRQFSLAQLLAVVWACGVFLAMARLIWTAPQTQRLEWVVLIVAWIAAAALFAIVKLWLASQVSVIFTAFVLFLCIMAPALSESRHAARRSVCQGHLKQIVVALHSYHDEYGTFPPAVVRDASGRPMHSWRVLLLPYLEEGDLYKQYRFDEPWDGPNNKKLHDITVPSYVCPERSGRESNPIADTNYTVVIGRRTAFPEDRCVALSDMIDDHGHTILVVEVANSGIRWLEPRDLHVTQMARQINAPRGQGISSPHPTGGANVVMVDGTLRFLDARLTPDQLEGLLTIAGGEKVAVP
jgi:uncharacterized protein DUF1559